MHYCIDMLKHGIAFVEQVVRDTHIASALQTRSKGTEQSWYDYQMARTINLPITHHANMYHSVGLHLYTKAPRSALSRF